VFSIREQGESNMAEDLKVKRRDVRNFLENLAARDAGFREDLIKDPKGLIERQFNTSLGNLNVKSVVETEDTLYVVVPPSTGEGELGLDALEKVAGGDWGAHAFEKLNISINKFIR
jgi:hypothetical protein